MSGNKWETLDYENTSQFVLYIYARDNARRGVHNQEVMDDVEA